MTDDLTADAADRVADALRALPGVEHVAITHVDPRVSDRRSLEVTHAAGYERVPPRVLRTLAEHDCGVVDVTRQGEHPILLAI